MTEVTTKDSSSPDEPQETKVNEDEVEELTTKKQKIMSTSISGSIEQAPDSGWPEAWYMNEENESEQEQKAANRQVPNKGASIADLRKIGIQYWKMDADAYTYPVKAVPWDPKDAVDPKLSALRDDSEYPYDMFSYRRT